MLLPNLIYPLACLRWVLYLQRLFETLKKHMICKIVIVMKSTNTSVLFNDAITVKLHCNYTVVTITLVAS